MPFVPAMRLLCLLLPLTLLAACREAPEAPSPEGTENPLVETPLEVPPESLVAPTAPRIGREPGIAGSDTAEEAWAVDGGACYAFADYVVRTAPAAGFGERIRVVPRTGSDPRALCDGGDALVDGTPDPAAFFGLAGDLLFLDQRASDGGPMLRIVDLASGQVVLEADYDEPIELTDGQLTYAAPPRVYDNPGAFAVSGFDCADADAWFEDGLGVGVSPVMAFDLSTRTTQPTERVVCVPLQ